MEISSLSPGGHGQCSCFLARTTHRRTTNGCSTTFSLCRRTQGVSPGSTATGCCLSLCLARVGRSSLNLLQLRGTVRRSPRGLVFTRQLTRCCVDGKGCRSTVGTCRTICTGGRDGASILHILIRLCRRRGGFGVVLGAIDHLRARRNRDRRFALAGVHVRRVVSSGGTTCGRLGSLMRRRPLSVRCGAVLNG